MEMKKDLSVNGLISKMYGGLDMSWKNVVLFAVGTAVLTAFFLIVPVFKDTSFEMMGTVFEAWIFFAVIVMANCKKPLESALKTFVFFLISQPLIYLLQVPFSFVGWGIFNYYHNWIGWTLLTFPMAFVGWFITKKNWWSVLIFAPVFAYLGAFGYGYGFECVQNFPHYLIAALFCLMQIVLYIMVFFPDIKQKIVGILVPLITVIAVLLITPRQTDQQMTYYLPNDSSFSPEATIAIDDRSIADVQLLIPEEGFIYINMHTYGTATLTVTDGGAERQYMLELYEDNGDAQMKITSIGQDGPAEE